MVPSMLAAKLLHTLQVADPDCMCAYLEIGPDASTDSMTRHGTGPHAACSDTSASWNGKLAAHTSAHRAETVQVRPGIL